MNVKRYLVSLPEDLARWLDSHEEYRASGLFAKAVREAMEKETVIPQGEARFLNEQEASQ